VLDGIFSFVYDAGKHNGIYQNEKGSNANLGSTEGFKYLRR